MISFFLISNMYPTNNSPGYGSFVKNISEALHHCGIIQKHSALIKGRNTGIINKLLKYISFYSQIVINFWKNYDFIYIHFPNQAVPILAILLKLYPRKLVINLHGEDLMYSKTGYGNILGNMMENMCKKYANAIIVPSSYFKDIVISRNIIQPNKIIISPSGGINPSIFFPNLKKLYNNEYLHLGYVGRIEKDKGIIEYLEAFNNLYKKGIKIKGTIIGYGNYYERAQQYIKDNDLSSIIEIIPGVPQQELGQYYRSMDLLIFSSSRDSESLGLTGIEAMACGTPIIGSNIGGIKTYLTDGKNGFLTRIHNTDDIVNAILKYVNLSLADKKIMSNNAITTGKSYYTPIVSEELAENLNKIIDFK